MTHPTRAILTLLLSGATLVGCASRQPSAATRTSAAAEPGPAEAAPASTSPTAGLEEPPQACPAPPAEADPTLDPFSPENERYGAAIRHGARASVRSVTEASLEDVRAENAQRPGDAVGAYTEGLLLARLGDAEGAFAAYRRALRARPRFAWALYAAGNVLHGMGRTDEAREHFQRAVEADPGHAGAWYNLGVIHYVEGRFEDALAELRCALALEPDDFEARTKVVQALHALDRFEEAEPVIAELRRRWERGEAPDNRAGVCIDQLRIGAEQVIVYEYFHDPHPTPFHFLFICKRGDETVRTVQLESSAVLRERGTFGVLAMSVGDTHSTFPIGFRARPSYETLRPVVVDLIRQIQAGSPPPAASTIPDR